VTNANIHAIKIKERFEKLKPFLSEKQIRLWAAIESETIGYGGISAVAQETGVSRRAITTGHKELSGQTSVEHERTRRLGGGRKKATEKDHDLKAELEKLIDPFTRGDPESPLRWTAKSVRNLASELKTRGHPVSRQVVADLLREMGYSLQANKKTIEGGTHPDRNAQFEYINQKVKDYQALGQPVISVDTKKKELVGNFRNNGRELRPKKKPEEVNVYDFQIPELGKVSPYGVYDIAKNVGWVNVGIDHDTAQFAVQSIRSWWLSMGKQNYREAKKLLITADGGGSNGSHTRLWKSELQTLANEIGLEISVCHFPPGTSKWNKIEHRLFSFISQNWRGKPLVSHRVIVDLIASTKTKTGLKVKCHLDEGSYPTGIKVSDEEMLQLKLIKDLFHGDWNYTILPDVKL
jgi:transposase